MTKLHALADLGQSVWYDNIRRALLESGELQALIDAGVRGVTSNPSIFEKAIAGSTDYDEDLHRLVDEGKPVEAIYEALALEDIRRTADLLRPRYDQTRRLDGYVSLEVSPTLAHDTQGTIEEARRLFEVLDRPNVMIKVPATPAGIPAIETLIAAGINVNVTLIFSLSSYEAVAEAYLRGLEIRAERGDDLSGVASVASFFVSRVDAAVDWALEAIRDRVGAQRVAPLRGTIAVANAKVAYDRFTETFSGERWERLAAKGARLQRPLWASTSTKNPEYPDTLYVDSLIGPDTVSTIPPSTLNAFLDHGTVARTIDQGLAEARARLAQLADLEIDIDAITQKLLDDGVDAFARSFESLMDSISEKRDRLLAGWEHQTASLGGYQEAVDSALSEMAEEKVVSRIWSRDHTVWKPDPTEITNRLGWLHTAEVMLDNLHRLSALVEAVRSEGYTHALLLGMGGSSLAPEVFRKTFGVRVGHLDLAVLDSTDPGAVADHASQLDPTRTLFIISTKSGGTVETLSFFKFFYNLVAEALGEARAGEHFVAITDPGSKLEELAARYGFRAAFLNDPAIGGRYSALSYFGLVPAATVGVNVARLLDRALATSSACDSCVAALDNPGARLGAIIGELAKAGRDKLTLIASPAIASFGDWVEQLIAESTGKEGKGILPVVGEPLGPPGVYGDDRLFVSIELEGDGVDRGALEALEGAGHPVVRLQLRDLYDLGGQFFLWEMATAIAGQRLGINPFDQPNVEAAKALAREMAAEYERDGALPTIEPTIEGEGVTVYADREGVGDAAGPAEALEAFLKRAQPGAYVAIQAYLQPMEVTADALQTLREEVRAATRLATTVGYGPRFLHSTGQLHKGDAGLGLFVQITADNPEDLPIPDEAGSVETSITFGVLKDAQALGDRQALLDAGRRVIRFHLGDDVAGGLDRLTETFR